MARRSSLRWWGSARLALALLALFTAGAARATPPSTALFAISIGYNRSPDPELPTLKYADDDAVRNFLLLRELGARALLLTEMDAGTSGLFPELKPLPPSLAALRASLAEINRNIDQARAQGIRTALYLFYTGHGDVRDGEGYVQVSDGALTRALLADLLSRVHADAIHLVVDACKSYFLIFERGPGGKRRPAGQPFLLPGKGIPPQTGLFLSTSAATESHEWEAFQGGIFSHEVRSAMRGAADLNRDGRVTYEEVAAFVYTANRAVPNERYRPRFLVRPPTGHSEASTVFADLRNATGRRMTFDTEVSGHFFVEDDVGVRLVDLHHGNKSLELLLPETGKLFVRHPAKLGESMLPGQHRILVSQLSWSQAKWRVRGSENEAFRRLFSVPFDDNAVICYRARPPENLVDQAPRRPISSWLRPTVGALGLATLVAGGVLTALAAGEGSSVNERTSNLERQEVNSRIDRYNHGAVACYIAGGTMAAAYLVWRLWPIPKLRVTLSPMARGASLQLGGRF